jgi:chromosome partitioning protein
MLPIVIAVAGIKGGTGKTMMAVNLATAAESMGIRAAVIDMDAIESAGKWAEGRSKEARPPVFAATANNLRNIIDDAGRSGAQVAIIDTPGHREDIAEAAIDVAALVLIPSRPIGSEIMALLETVHLVADARKIGAIVFTAVPFRAPELAQGRALVEGMNLPLAPVFLSDFRVYFRAFAAGRGVTEYETSGHAAGEVRALWDWIIEQIEISAEQEKAAPRRAAHRRG